MNYVYNSTECSNFMYVYANETQMYKSFWTDDINDAVVKINLRPLEA